MTGLGLMAGLAVLAALARWMTFNRAARARRFDDPIGAIFALWLEPGQPNHQPDASCRAHSRRSFT